MRRRQNEGSAGSQLTISRSLQILAAVLLGLFVGAAALQLAHMRHSRLAETERQMMQLNMVFAEQTGRAMESVDLILRSLGETLQLLQIRPPVDVAYMDSLMRRGINGVRQVRDVAFVGVDGTITFASRDDLGETLTRAAKAAASEDAQRPGTNLRISTPIRDEAGRWTALMTRRIDDPDGVYLATVIGFLDLQYFEDFYRGVELNEGGAIVLHRRDGTVLARFPHAEQIIGKTYADTPPFKDVLAHAMFGTTIMDSPLDGSRRVVAIRALKAFPLAVIISVDEGRVLLEWRSEAWFLGSGAILAGGMVSGLLLLLARWSRQNEVLMGEFRGARDLAQRTNERLIEQMEERQQAEAALRQAQRIEAVGQLTGGVAHDFNNLLTVILGNVDMLLQGGVPAATADRLGTIRSAADRGATLTAQLLAFARRQPLVPQAVDMNGVILGMRTLLQSALRSTVEIETVMHPGLWPAKVDPTQVELVVLNLAINGRDAMPGGGRLTITTANVHLDVPLRPEDPPAGDYVQIAVGDEGHGMTAEVLAKAFEPFFTTKPTGAGSGLGLSQVYGLARQSGGSVRIDSSPEAGTTVRVYLPRAQDIPRIAPPRMTALQGSGSGARILLVDDDEAVRTTTATILEGLGYIVIQADGAAAGMEILTQMADIDLLLTDVAMPGVSGPELARQAAALRQGLPVVFISGFADPEHLTGDTGMRRLVRKPFRIATLVTQIESALSDAAVEAA